MKETATLSLVRHINYNLILDFLLSNGAATIPKISDEIGLSLPTVTRAVEFGMEKNMIVSTEIAPSSRGRKALLYKINSEYTYFLLIALDNEKFHCEVRDFACSTIHEEVIPVSYDQILPQLKTAVSALINKFPKITHVGISLSGVIYNGTVVDSWTTSSLNGINLKEPLQALHKINFVIENNMKALAMAAKQRVDRHEEKTVVAFEFGHTGYGAGIIVNGKILHGRNGSAGELGSIFPPYEKGTDKTSIYCNGLKALISILNPDSVIIYSDEEIEIQKVIYMVRQNVPSYAFPEILKLNSFVSDCIDGLNLLSIEEIKKELEKD